MYKIKALLMFIVFSLVFGLVTMLMWNWLVPEIFHGPTLTYLQAIGILVLSKILFGGHGGRHRRHWGGHWGHHRGGYWCDPEWRKRWEEMSLEDRQKMKEEW